MRGRPRGERDAGEESVLKLPICRNLASAASVYSKFWHWYKYFDDLNNLLNWLWFLVFSFEFYIVRRLILFMAPKKSYVRGEGGGRRREIKGWLPWAPKIGFNSLPEDCPRGPQPSRSYLATVPLRDPGSSPGWAKVLFPPWVLCFLTFLMRPNRLKQVMFILLASYRGRFNWPLAGNQPR